MTLDLTEDEFKLLHIIYLEWIIINMRTGMQLNDFHTDLMQKFSEGEKELDKSYPCDDCCEAGDCHDGAYGGNCGQ